MVIPMAQAAPPSARPQRAVSALWNVGLSARRHDSPQLMRMSLGGWTTVADLEA